MRMHFGLAISTAAFIFVCSAIGAEPASLELPVKVNFLAVPANAIKGRFVLKAGRVYVENEDGKMVQSELPALTTEPLASYEGEGVYILGAPAVVSSKRLVELPALLANGKTTVRGSVLDNNLLFVGEKRAADPSNSKRVVTSFSIYLAKGAGIQALATFSFQDNVFNQYLDQIWPIDRRTLAIVAHSSRHPAINTLFLFDLDRKTVVGMREFSEFEYLPPSKSFWMMQSVANCDNMKEVLDAARKNAVVVPIYADGVISNAFKAVAGITQSAP